MRRASPYSTGGGGTVLEHRYGALLLSHLLTGDPLTELGDDVTLHEVAFQASAVSAVDDFVVTGFAPDGSKRTVSIGVRRDPSFVPSDTASVELIGSYLRVLRDQAPQVASGRWQLGLTVSGSNAHVKEIAELATIARDVADERAFRSAVAFPGRTNQANRRRLEYLDEVVAAAARAVGIDTASGAGAAGLTWRFLSALRVRELRMEGVDQSDRTHAVARLRHVTSAGTAEAADALFSRLAELAGRYAPAAASKDAASLRRDLVGVPLARIPGPARNPGTAGLSSPARNPRPRNGRKEIPSGPAPTAAPEPSAGGPLVHAGPVVRSDYLAQVRRIAPAELRGREQELADMVEFCTSQDAAQAARSYLWWRAEAWAGKSALLSSFVLAPPAGVRVVSFFITARLAGQGDRIAFADVVLEQLLEILGAPMPTLLTDATRDAHLLGALERAADLCRARGERLVLVVDGLDEDQGVTAGPDAHSIAAMLPSRPPAGMRVIVAGRPNPPIPTDVPDDHPLRRSDIARRLRVSPHAAVVRQDAERELKRLLRGSPTEQDLLGLLTASGGGLSGADLADLTGLAAWEVEECLGAVSGRTFAPRAARWQRGTVVYVLGHEELQQQAAGLLGAARLGAYRDRLHAWADGYRRRRWPVDTPEYLLRGYFRLLLSTGDLTRTLACATDPGRHDRMLDIIGGDTVALAEITAAQEAVAGHAVPDLLSLSRLAVHRTVLTDRNVDIPANLPGVWAQLGQHSRAEALARSITDPARRVQALAAVAREAAGSGDLRGAGILTDHAEQLVAAITDPHRQAVAVAAVARAAAASGDRHRALLLASRAEATARSTADETRHAHTLVAAARAFAAAGDDRTAQRVATSVTTWSERAQALGVVAVEVANSGQWQRGRGLARSVASRSERAQVLTTIARAASATGHHRAARQLITEAEAIAHAIRNPARKAWILIGVAHALSACRERDRALDLLDLAERLARPLTRSSDRDTTLSALARVLATVGAPDRAMALARSVANPARQARALADVASGLVADGQDGHATAVAREAEGVARSHSRPVRRSSDLSALSKAAATDGGFDQAAALAYAIPEPPQRDRALTVITQALATTGDLDRAVAVADTISDPTQQDKALLLVVRAAVAAADLARAVRIADAIRGTEEREKALGAIPTVPVDNRSTGHATSATAPDGSTSLPAQEATPADPVDDGAEPIRAELIQAEQSAREISHPYQQAKALIAVARRAEAAAEPEQAERSIGAITHPQLRAGGFAALAVTVAGNGDAARSRRLLGQAELAADSITKTPYREQAISEIARTCAQVGDLPRAEELARSITTEPLRATALADVASVISAAGAPDRAASIIHTIDQPRTRARALAETVRTCLDLGDPEQAEHLARLILEPRPQAEALAAIAHHLAKAGEPGRAEQLARSIADPSEQARTLAAMAPDLPPADGRRVLAHALIIGHWQLCLPTLLRLEPGALGVLSEELLDSTDRTDPA